MQKHVTRSKQSKLSQRNTESVAVSPAPQTLNPRSDDRDESPAPQTSNSRNECKDVLPGSNVKAVTKEESRKYADFWQSDDTLCLSSLFQDRSSSSDPITMSSNPVSTTTRRSASICSTSRLTSNQASKTSCSSPTKSSSIRSTPSRMTPRHSTPIRSTTSTIMSDLAAPDNCMLIQCMSNSSSLSSCAKPGHQKSSGSSSSKSVMMTHVHQPRDKIKTKSVKSCLSANRTNTRAQSLKPNLNLSSMTREPDSQIAANMLNNCVVAGLSPQKCSRAAKKLNSETGLQTENNKELASSNVKSLEAFLAKTKHRDTHDKMKSPPRKVKCTSYNVAEKVVEEDFFENGEVNEIIGAEGPDANSCRYGTEGFCTNSDSRGTVQPGINSSSRGTVGVNFSSCETVGPGANSGSHGTEGPGANFGSCDSCISSSGCSLPAAVTSNLESNATEMLMKDSRETENLLPTNAAARSFQNTELTDFVKSMFTTSMNNVQSGAPLSSVTASVGRQTSKRKAAIPVRYRHGMEPVRPTAVHSHSMEPPCLTVVQTHSMKPQCLTAVQIHNKEPAYSSATKPSLPLIEKLSCGEVDRKTSEEVVAKQVEVLVEPLDESVMEQVEEMVLESEIEPNQCNELVLDTETSRRILVGPAVACPMDTQRTIIVGEASRISTEKSNIKSVTDKLNLILKPQVMAEAEDSHRVSCARTPEPWVISPAVTVIKSSKPHSLKPESGQPSEPFIIGRHDITMLHPQLTTKASEQLKATPSEPLKVKPIIIKVEDFLKSSAVKPPQSLVVKQNPTESVTIKPPELMIVKKPDLLNLKQDISMQKEAIALKPGDSVIVKQTLLKPLVSLKPSHPLKLSEPVTPTPLHPLKPEVIKSTHPVVLKPTAPMLFQRQELKLLKPFESGSLKPTSQFIVKRTEPLVVKPVSKPTLSVTLKPMESVTLKKTQPMILNKLESGVPKPAEPVTLKPTQPIILKQLQPGILKPSELVALKPSQPLISKQLESVVVKPSGPVALKPSQPLISKQLESGVAKPSEPVALKPSKPVELKPVMWKAAVKVEVFAIGVVKTEAGVEMRVKGLDHNETVKGDDNAIVKGDDNETVKEDDNETVNGDDNETVKGNDNETVKGDDNETLEVEQDNMTEIKGKDDNKNMTEMQTVRGIGEVKVDDDGNVTCHLCDKKFEHVADLEVHMFNKHFCIICDREFKQSSNLHKHIRTSHTTLRPHVCSLCGKAFSYQSYLKEHMQVSLPSF